MSVPGTQYRREDPLPSSVEFGREICGDLEAAERREWLITNGIGGFASGTVSGLLTRRYHGLLVAALHPPLGRTLLVSHFQETANYDGRSFPLATSRWAGGVVNPQGYRQIERFRLEGTTPVWIYACADALLEKRVWMPQGSNTTYVRYKMLGGGRPLQLDTRAFVNYRDYHGNTHAGGWRMDIQPVAHGIRIVAFEGATPFYLLSGAAEAAQAHDWHYNFDLSVERDRGLDDREDHLHAGTFRANLRPGDSVTIVVSTEPSPNLDGENSYLGRVAHERSMLDRWVAAHPSLEKNAPAWVRQLVLAADQFIVKHPLPDDHEGSSVIAGYPWFGVWGRDTMIALPGLTLSTGRPEITARILRSSARFVDRGMLPNFFPEAGQAPEYNTVDAALWYFEALRQYVSATNDHRTLAELFPVLAEVIDWHLRGTRYNIHVDPGDGLLYAGEPGVQLTWMDAKMGDWVVTPRIGKPVEINALWFNALGTMAQFARILERGTAEYDSMAKRARAGFARFWNGAAQCCFDVIDGPGGNDPAIRPNQILAVSLPKSPLQPEQRRAVVDTCARHLLVPYGLRSLAPSDPHYRGRYLGPPVERDSAYHQGTVWAWLLGQFVLAHLRVYNDPAQAAGFLEPLSRNMTFYGLGTVGEIFDGDAPFTARGCIAQAWSVGEMLRAWVAVAESRAGANSAMTKGFGEA